ncbi:hypothetical protein BS47DRAFT_1487791 [Hydnum rufescens UP504]|uniref:Ras-GEF domain-containing protein n=1 Tax=Hydnum rufescens UP504 TaxID=1448309 RepID=A0A9P6APY6_9AGAM|nr:hypothetical protein BS47DRAFT_1487791 [Hydnum rufescens UP504]
MSSCDESPVLTAHVTTTTTQYDDSQCNMYNSETVLKDVFHSDPHSSSTHTKGNTLADVPGRLSLPGPEARVGRAGTLCNCKRLDPACTNRSSAVSLTTADGTIVPCPFSSLPISAHSPDDPSRPFDPLRIRFRSPYLMAQSNDIDVVYEGTFPPLIDIDDNESVASESSFGTDSTISSSWDALPFPELNVNDLMLDFDGSVLGGTLSALVERLTHAEYPGNTCRHGFPRRFHDDFYDIYDPLRTISRIDPSVQPRHPSEISLLHNLIIGNGLFEGPVINTLKSIIQDYKFTTREEFDLLTDIENFLRHDALDAYPSAKRLLDSILLIRNGESSVSTRRIAYDAIQPPPHLEPLEVARQLILMESRVLREVHPKDLLAHGLRDYRGSSWRSPDTSALSILLRRLDEASRWVCSTILARDSPQDRALVINHFITIAEACRSLNSLTMTAAIFSGLTSLPVARLYQSWAELRCPTSIAMFLTIQKFLAVAENPSEYRTMVKCLVPPCLPDIRVYLAAIRQIHQTMRDNLDADGNVINFRKRHELASVIAEIQNLQWKPYNLVPVEPIRAFLQREVHSAYPMGRLFDWSLQREPDLSLPTLPTSLVPL